MKATIVAFDSVIEQLKRGCIISTQNSNAADIRLNQPWDGTVKIMEEAIIPFVLQQTESHQEKWARKRAERGFST